MKVEPAKPLEVNHELMLETIAGTCELKSVEIFLNDVYIGDIVDATKYFRTDDSSDIKPWSSLEWLVRKVRDRIILSSLRRYIGRGNKSRLRSESHSFEYVDEEGMLICEVGDGVDGLIKLPPCWPLGDLTVELKSLEVRSRQQQHRPKQAVLAKVVDIANSLNVETRRNISLFVDCIKQILTQQMQGD